MKEDKAVEDSYISSIINTVESTGPYMVIDKGIALVHGELDKGVKKTGLSMLIITEGVNFGSRYNDPVYLILCLAAKDTYSHNKALNDFLEIINDFKKNRNKYNDIEYVISKVLEVSERKWKN